MYRYFLALRFLLSRPINLLGTIGIMLGVWALIVVVSIFSGFLREVEKHLQSSTADLTAVGLPADADFASLAKIIEADPNVFACAPRVIWQGLVHPFGDRAVSGPMPLGMHELGANTPFVSIIGVDPARERRVTELHLWLDRIDDPAMRVRNAEHPLAAIDGKDSILLSRQRMEAEGVSTGDRARLTTGRMVRSGRRELLDFPDRNFRVGGAFETTYAGFDGLNVFVHVDALRRQLGHEPTDGWVNEVAIKLVDPGRAIDTAARLDRALNEDRSLRSNPITVRTWAQANGPQLGAIQHQRSLMKLVLFVILVVAAFLMFATLSMMVLEKTHDIGILTAMGASPRGVASVFFWCGASIVAAGIALGVGSGCLSAIFLDDINSWLKAQLDIDLFRVDVYNLRRVPYDLDVTWILQVSGWALLVGIIISVLPAWRAARHDPLVSLRNE